MNEFGDDIIVFEVLDTAVEDMFGTGRPIKLLRVLGDKPLVEVESAARAVDKTGARLLEWAIATDPELIYDCEWCGERMKAIEARTYVQFLVAESEVDNPYAIQALGRSQEEGVNHQLKKAMAEGRDYIQLPNSEARIRFHVQNGQPYLSMDDLAQVLGVSPEEMEESLKSEEFAAHRRNAWD